MCAFSSLAHAPLFDLRFVSSPIHVSPITLLWVETVYCPMFVRAPKNAGFFGKTQRPAEVLFMNHPPK